MTNTRQQLHNMYIGFVYVNWAREDTQLGTAKQKALKQMHTYAKTVDKNNPVTEEINSHVAEMTKSVSKQIMTDKSSDMLLDKKQAPQYKAFGERQIEASKKELSDMVKRAQKSMKLDKTPEFVKAQEKLTEIKDFDVKKKAPQYRAVETNVAAKTPESMQKRIMDQETLIRLLKQRQNAA